LSLQTLKKLSLIGMGRMGKSMVGGWLNSGLSTNKIQIIDPNISVNDKFITENGLSKKSLEEIDLTQGTIVIAVKPQVVENILIALRGKLTSETTIISIVAGYSTKDIRNYIGMEPKLIRTMPNTPAAIGKGMTAIFSDSTLDQNIRSEAEALFSAIGEYCWIDDEDQMHIITAISGSGPAYYYLLTECLIEIASSRGLERDNAALLVEQTFTGSAALAESSPNISPAQQRQNVTSPGGTTEAALKILMEDDKLKRLLDLAINSAAERSKNLSK
tara:strand:+ start:4627 stop:5448 length:822 start_codon:yes stop_codon:yes gene_type:complete